MRCLALRDLNPAEPMIYLLTPPRGGSIITRTLEGSREGELRREQAEERAAKAARVALSAQARREVLIWQKARIVEVGLVLS